MDDAKSKRVANLAIMAEALGADPGTFDKALRLPKVEEPWAKVQLSKKERKGKTPEELQFLRKEIWNKAQV